MMLPSLRSLGLALMATTLISGCSILPKSEPKTSYNLPASTLEALSTSKNVALLVAKPQANRLINSNHILVLPNSAEIQMYKGSQWADNAPALLRDRLLLALNDTQLFRAVTSDGALNTKFALESVLNRFQVQYQNNEPVIVVELEAQLIDRMNSNILSSKRFTQNVAATSEKMPDVITAFGQASDALSIDLLNWLQQQPHLN